MPQLTPTQVQLLIAAAALLGGFVGWLGRGGSFLLARWWTGSSKREQASYLNTVADFGAKLRASGMTMGDVAQLEAMMRNPAVEGSDAAVAALVGPPVEAVEPEGFSTNVGMQIRTGAALEVAGAQLRQTIADLHLVVGEAEDACLELAQEKWAVYRDALQECAYREYEGGTHAPLAAALAGLAETERRTAELKAMLAERSSR